MGIEAFRYDGKRALVVGGATGMGAAVSKIVSDLGGEVVVMDYADVSFPVAKAIKVDLRSREAVDAAIDECGGPVHALFSCAGIADGPGTMTINFIAHRHIIDRLVDGGMMPSGSAIALISSVAGLGWENNLPTIKDFLTSPDFETAQKWVDAHEGTDNYMFSKQAINAYVGLEAFPLLKRGIRINAILPGPTDTPLARANADTWLTFAADYREAAGSETLTPEQMGNALAFLCSDAASGVNGITMLVDSGHVSSAVTDSFPAPMIKMMMGMAT